MLSAEELIDIRSRGAVCDTRGRLFDREGREIIHELSNRTVAVEPDNLRGRQVVLAAVVSKRSKRSPPFCAQDSSQVSSQTAILHSPWRPAGDFP